MLHQFKAGRARLHIPLCGREHQSGREVGVRAHAGKGAEPSLLTLPVLPRQQGDLDFPKAMTNLKVCQANSRALISR